MEDNTKILDTKIQKLSEIYKEDEEKREQHLAGRFLECYEQQTHSAYKLFAEKNGDEAIPVLIGKYFSWLLIKKAGDYGIDIRKASGYVSLILGNNPQKPAEQNEWQEALDIMETKLDNIAKRLQGTEQEVINDYILWLLSKDKNAWDSMCYIFGPKELVASPDIDQLIELVQQRIKTLSIS